MPGREIPSGRCWEGVFQLTTCLVLAPKPSGVLSVRTGQTAPPPRHSLPQAWPSTSAQSQVPVTPQPWHGGLCHQEHGSLPGSPGISRPIAGHSSAVGPQGASAQSLDTQGGFVLGAEKGSERRRAELMWGDG